MFEKNQEPAAEAQIQKLQFMTRKCLQQGCRCTPQSQVL
jgi:hypothetical protein